MAKQTWFLGANAPGGFSSLYSQFTTPDRGSLYILKGGPGCGKSTFMRRISQTAQDAGLDVEEIRCSGDPNSLDGVYIPALRKGYVDGTAPHVIEPSCPGSADLYLNFSVFYDEDALKPKKEDLQKAFSAYKAEYARAYHWLGAAKAVEDAALSPFHDAQTENAVRRRAQGFCARLLPPSGNGTETKRYLSALTGSGNLTLWDTADALADTVCTLDNTYSLAPVFLETVLDAARKKGLSRIICPDPMSPNRIAHLIFPEASLAFLSVTPEAPYPKTPFRHIRLDAMLPRKLIQQERASFRKAAKLRTALLCEAADALGSANRLHDALEELYRPHVNFDALERFTNAYIQKFHPF